MTLRGWLGLLVVAGICGIIFVLWPRFESDPPAIGELAPIAIGGYAGVVAIDVTDGGSGLRSLEVRIEQAGRTHELAAKSYAGGWIAGGTQTSEQLEFEVDAKQLGLADGEAKLVVLARDWSLRDMGSGNSIELVVPVVVDTRSPRIAIQNGLTYIARGGSGVAIYTVDEPTSRDGVRVGDVFFSGYPLTGQDARRVSFFAIPVHAETGPKIDVIAIDAAGNESKRGFPARVIERRFSDSRITLPASFFERVAVPLAEDFGFDATDPETAFTRVNKEGRERSEQDIQSHIANSSPQRLWEGGFQQLANSKVTSQFAESRTYFTNGKQISAATHYGFDLASTARDSITSSNSGVVLFAGPLGIYGDTVLVDHGQGIVSLYAHLSQMDVAAGDPVKSGQQLGLSGATGLAGGDHLHFAILVGGVYVDPLEWWDATWIRTHVDEPIAASGG